MPNTTRLENTSNLDVDVLEATGCGTSQLVRSCSVVVNTPPCQGGSAGSNPVRTAMEYDTENRIVKIAVKDLLGHNRHKNWESLRHYLESLLGEYMTDWLFDWQD